MLAQAGVSDYTGHDNRHWARSVWVMEGVPLVAVARYAAHSTIQLTMRYAHFMLGASQIACSVVDAFCANASRKGPELTPTLRMLFHRGVYRCK